MSTDGTKEHQKHHDRDGLHKRRGIWHFKINVNGKWREISTHTRIYSEAKDVRKRSIQSHDTGRLSLKNGKVPFKNAAEIWTSSRKGEQLALNTLRVERERLIPLLQTFGEKKLSTFSLEDLLVYRAERSKRVGPRTINLEIKVLRMILQRAKCWNGLAEEYKPLREDTKGPGIALSLEEERKLFENASAKPSWEAAYLGGVVAVNTTMRGGELRGLRLGSIDLFNKTVSIRRDSTKTDAGCRVIPLNETATWAFVRLMRRAERLGATESDHYIFPAFMFRHTKEDIGAKGAGYDPTRPAKGWRSAWRSLKKAAGMPKLRFHDLRHTCITKLAEAGVPDHVMMSISGHLSPEMIKHYSHIRTRAKQSAVAAIENHSYRPMESQVTPSKPM